MPDSSLRTFNSYELVEHDDGPSKEIEATTSAYYDDRMTAHQRIIADYDTRRRRSVNLQLS